MSRCSELAAPSRPADRARRRPAGAAVDAERCAIAEVHREARSEQLQAVALRQLRRVESRAVVLDDRLAARSVRCATHERDAPSRARRDTACLTLFSTRVCSDRRGTSAAPWPGAGIDPEAQAIAEAHALDLEIAPNRRSSSSSGTSGERASSSDDRISEASCSMTRSAAPDSRASARRSN